MRTVADSWPFGYAHGAGGYAWPRLTGYGPLRLVISATKPSGSSMPPPM
jgi:hypothetical protein